MPEPFGSLDSELNDVLDGETMEDVLQLLSRPTDMMSCVSPEQLKTKGLAGYQELQAIKDVTAQYRQGYADWRRGAARGARGEASLNQEMQGSLASQMVLPHERGLIPPVSSTVAVKDLQVVTPNSASRKSESPNNSRMSSRPSSRASRSSKDRWQPEAIAENGEVLEVEYGDPSDEGSSLAHDDAKGSWLKFGFNPFSELPQASKVEAAPLRAANVAAIASAGPARLSVPAEGSRAVDCHIAHIGVGGFHRSHLAYVTDVLMQKQHAGALGGERWGIIGVGLMPWDRKIANVLLAQDCLYTLLLRGNEGASARVIGSIVDFVFVPDSPAASLQRLCAPSVRIISLTVTEKGYYRTVGGDLDLDNPLIHADVSSWSSADGGASGLACPQTAFGLICTVLQRRRRAGLGPLTVLSCDNLPMNGSVCRAMTLAFARAVDAELGAWMEACVPFPNSMVDRITPATEDEHRRLLRDEYGIDDDWPVIAEPFLQWVIEDTFCAGRPAWQAALPDDVLITLNVEPYELMKLRLLNSSHSALSYAAMLCEHTFVDNALADPDVFSFVRAYMLEVVKTLSEVQGVDLADYQRSLLRRFSNRYIKDKLGRLAQDGSQKFMNTLRDALLGYREQQAFVAEMLAKSSWLVARDAKTAECPQTVALALAAFMRYACGVDDKGEALKLEDPLAAQLQPPALRAYRDPDGRRPDAVERAERLDSTRQFLRLIFGDEVASWDTFASAVAEYADAIRRVSIRKVLRHQRHVQLRHIRAEKAELEASLKELTHHEALLTSEAERDAATKFYQRSYERSHAHEWPAHGARAWNDEQASAHHSYADTIGTGSGIGGLGRIPRAHTFIERRYTAQ